ncbi:MAG: CBS domain-containing protein [Nitrospirota bacterium]|nr:CBS domain-containing protein [Nitrospirota bacterium]
MSISAWHIMKEKISVGPDTTAQETAMRIISSGLAAMPVVNDSNDLLGVVTENGILGAIRDGLDLSVLPASKVLVPAPVTADVTASTDELVRLLMQSCCSMVTVTRDGKYAGVVTRHMLMDIFTSPHYSRFASKERKAPFVCL